MTKIFVFPYFVATLCVIDTARILGVFPSPSVSHQVVFRVLIQELARRGHEVVMITADPAFPEGQAPANLTEIDVHDISYKFLREMLSEVLTEYEFGKEVPWINTEKLTNIFFNVMEVQVKSEPVQKLIQGNRQFDILLIEAYMRPAIAYTYIFKAPVILVSSFGATPGNLEVFGAPTHPILYPSPYRQRLFNLSLWDKLREYYYHAQYMHLQKSNARFDDNLARRMFGPNVPPISELNKNVDMLFLNVHPIWMNNQPVPPNIVFMGGIHQKPIKELPKDLKTYLDSSKNGVVYVSFGTNVQPKMFPSDRLKMITETFSALPYDILFKWNDDELPGRTDNIKISKWLPQSDLLRHPKVKAFVMQGGLQSTDEAITAGVPLVCIPMLGDQWYNAEKYVQLEIGLKLDLFKLTKTELKNAIETVVSNRSYRENIVKLRDRMNDQPQSPLERAVWWVEYVLRHGGAKHLRAPAANISWAEYYEVELVSVILASLLIINTAKILVVVPVPSISHQVVFRPLVKELINRDHEVTLITTDPVYSRVKSPNNLSEIDLHDLSYGLWNKLLSDLTKNEHRDILSVMTLVFRVLSIIFGEQLKHKSVHQLITDKTIKFDLLIVEACITPALIFSHIFKAPLIQMSSFGAIPGNMEVIGASTHPFLYPTHYHQKLYSLSIWEKMIELHTHLGFIRMFEKQEVNDNLMLQSIFGADVPPLSQLKNNVLMLFLNVHPIWLHGQPVPPNVIFTWGIHKVPEQTLPKDLQSYLDSSTNGAIYVSFGTNVKPSTIGAERVKIMVKVFSQLPYNILWKWDLDELPGKSENIKISKWFPQVDILRHPNLKLFITQGGLQSTDEAINAAVPLIGIPVLGDQAYNTAKYEHFKIGIQLDFNSITEQDLKMAIRNVFKDYESYRKNIITLRTQMQDQPKPPLENAIWWIEHVLRHGGAQHLRTPAANMSWTEYYELELVIVLLSGFIVLVASLLIAVYFCCKSMLRMLNLRTNKTKLS